MRSAHNHRYPPFPSGRGALQVLSDGELKEEVRKGKCLIIFIIQRKMFLISSRARVAELADALDLGTTNQNWRFLIKIKYLGFAKLEGQFGLAWVILGYFRL